MLSGLRRAIKTAAGATIGVTGFAIAASPLLQTVAASGTNYQQLPQNIAAQYGISSAGIDQGRLVNNIVWPVIGGLIFIFGLRAIVKHI